MFGIKMWRPWEASTLSARKAVVGSAVSLCSGRHHDNSMSQHSRVRCYDTLFVSDRTSAFLQTSDNSEIA